jgi:signal transduction histidine kinase
MLFRRALSIIAVLSCVSGVAVAEEVGSPAEAKALLARAVAEVAKSGVEASYKAFSDPKGAFVDRDLYVFCFSTSGIMKAHGGNPALLGKDFIAIKDSDGKVFVSDMIQLAVAAGEGWVDYKWPNPTTKKIESKSSFVNKVGDDVCGVGIYKK